MAVTDGWVGCGKERLDFEMCRCLRENSRPNLVLPKELWRRN